MNENMIPWKWVTDIALMLIVFLVVQTVINGVVPLVYSLANGESVGSLVRGMALGEQGQLLASASVMSSLVTILLFPRLKWTVVDRSYLRSHPWGVLLWCGLLTLGTILPFEWIYEQLQIQMSDTSKALFESVMREPWGYVALGILAPVAEEFVFRGGVLRALLGLFGQPVLSAGAPTSAAANAQTSALGRWTPLVAITLSALIFGAVHMNMAQGVHGFIMGLLLGWLYYRTGSMMPGIIVHWVNNTVAYLMYVLMPGLADGKLIDFFHGSQRSMVIGLLCSLCILLPSLFQVVVRTRK